MPRRWEPGQEWSGEDAYVVGGGPSVERFDWPRLRGRRVVCCNGAPVTWAVSDVVVFGDFAWWKRVGERGLGASFGGRVVGCNEKLRDESCPWLLTMDRLDHGLGRDKLGWNANTGSLALNLALILGARRVHLLGFDMRLGEGGKVNYHDLRHEKANADVYRRFRVGFDLVAQQLPLVFPGAEVVNVTDGSDLASFPKVGVEEHFRRAKT